MTDTPLLIRLAEDDDDFILSLLPRFVDFTLPPWRRRHECIEGIRNDLLRHLDDQPANSYLFVAEDADGEQGKSINLNGLFVINEEKLRALDEKTTHEFLREGVLGWAYAHLLSLTNIDRLARRLDVREQAEAAAASATN
jgi:hypothetical protein